jgi:hypothetical protein
MQIARTPQKPPTPRVRRRRHASIGLALVEAGRRNDRARFDRLFDAWFDVLYAIAWRCAPNARQCQALVSRILEAEIREHLPHLTEASRARRTRRAE